MAKKLNAQAKRDDQQLTEAVRASAQQIWQAGLGAFAKAQEEGGRVFSKLVKDGTDLQKRTRSKAEEKVADVRETVSGLADDIGHQAGGSWDKLEQVFEERVSRALGAIGVPTRKELQELGAQIAQLRQQVAELTAKKAAPKTAAKAAPKAAASKAAVKKPAAKKPAAKPSTSTPL